MCRSVQVLCRVPFRWLLDDQSARGAMAVVDIDLLTVIIERHEERVWCGIPQPRIRVLAWQPQLSERPPGRLSQVVLGLAFIDAHREQLLSMLSESAPGDVPAAEGRVRSSKGSGDSSEDSDGAGEAGRPS